MTWEEMKRKSQEMYLDRQRKTTEHNHSIEDLWAEDIDPELSPKIKLVIDPIEYNNLPLQSPITDAFITWSWRYYKTKWVVVVRWYIRLHLYTQRMWRRRHE